MAFERVIWPKFLTEAKSWISAKCINKDIRRPAIRALKESMIHFLAKGWVTAASIGCGIEVLVLSTSHSAIGSLNQYFDDVRSIALSIHYLVARLAKNAVFQIFRDEIAILD